MPLKIIVIDDEKNLRKIIKDYLENEGYEVLEGEDGMDGIEKIISNPDIDLILLDIRMPHLNGYEAIKEIKQVTDAPVIFLTALGEVFDEVRGLNLGADDYITKPFNYEVLMARVRSCLRKNRRLTEASQVFGRLRLDPDGKEAYVGGQSLSLTQKEYDLLAYLAANKNMTLNRSRILDRVWGYDYDQDPRTVDTHIKTLRAKLGICACYIGTIRGVGYKFEVVEDDIG